MKRNVSLVLCSKTKSGILTMHIRRNCSGVEMRVMNVVYCCPETHSAAVLPQPCRWSSFPRADRKSGPDLAGAF